MKKKMKKSCQKSIAESKILTKSILQGFTIDKMSEVLNCSKSAVSYKMTKLFQKYKANSRIDFALKIFSEILDKTKENLNKEIVKKERLLEFVNSQNTLLVNIYTNKDNPNKLMFWIDKAKEFCEKFTY